MNAWDYIWVSTVTVVGMLAGIALLTWIGMRLIERSGRWDR